MPSLDLGGTTNEKSSEPAEPAVASEAASSFALEKFVLWETKTRFYVVACDSAETRFRVLKIDRTATAAEGLYTTQDACVYSAEEIRDLERMIQVGNNGLSRPLKDAFHGIAGFVRFTAGWYAVLITRRTTVALLGGHYIYNCAETQLISVDYKPDRSAEEQRQLGIFHQFDLSKNFYFSLTYDLTNTLQHNMTRRVSVEVSRFSYCPQWGFNDRFIWNRHLLENGFPDTAQHNPWVLPLIYGSVDQAKISVFSQPIFVTLIGRRSRHFAGARFMKRGVTPEGHVANEVETEQITSETVTTPFWSPLSRSDARPAAASAGQGSRRQAKMNPKYTSFVQLRGSIPVYWTQNATNMQAKPPIDLSFIDPYFSAAARHFDNLFARYGTPVIVENLIKVNQRACARELKLLPELVQCIEYLNQSLPEEHRIIYRGFDMATANKSGRVDVISRLDDEAQLCLEQIGFFHSGPLPAAYAQRERDDPNALPYRSTIQLQQGVLRSNCIDCLDRTNSFQYVVGKVALGRQLYALGVLPEATFQYSCAVNDLLTEIYHDLGDTIALQYGGSPLVNTIHSYETQHPGQWRSHSRDTLNGIKRYYANSFSDVEKQRSIDLFLGLTEMVSSRMAKIKEKQKPYIRWWTPANLENLTDLKEAESRLAAHASAEPDLWVNHYRQGLATRFDLLFAFKMNGTLHLKARDGLLGDALELSPFRPVKDNERLQYAEERRRVRPGLAGFPGSPSSSRRQRPWLSSVRPVPKTTAQPGTTEAMAVQLANPVVSVSLEAEYDKYVKQSIIVSHDDRRIYEASRSSALFEPSHRALSLYIDACDLVR